MCRLVKQAVDEYEMCGAKLNVDWTTVERCCLVAAQSYAIFIWTRHQEGRLLVGYWSRHLLYVVKGLFS